MKLSILVVLQNLKINFLIFGSQEIKLPTFHEYIKFNKINTLLIWKPKEKKT